MFTSGSTGVPKGVPISHGNICSFLSNAMESYNLTAEDRLTQLFEHTFDLSIFDMFMAWSAGAATCILDDAVALDPGEYLRQQQISLWFSVPSLALRLARRGRLLPGSFPTLRWSLFCGEALSSEVAQSWHVAAPYSQIENLYGPTELTVACSRFTWTPSVPLGDYEQGIVPIGKLFSNLKGKVVDEACEEVPCGDIGELCVAGGQTFSGYWGATEDDARAFISEVSEDGWRYYRTGDLVAQRNDVFVFCGRKDTQIKLGGHRIELGQVEAALLVAGCDSAVALAWPDQTRPRLDTCRRVWAEMC